MQDERGGPVTMRHRDCGAEVEIELRCASGHRVDGEKLDLALSDSWSRRANSAS